MSILLSNPTSATAYLLLAAAVIAVFARARSISFGLAFLSLGAAFVGGILTTLGALSLAAFCSLCLWHFSLRRGAVNFNFPGASVVSGALVVLTAAAFQIHIVPGFENLKVLDRVEVSQGATPFSMYLNFDKVFTAFILASTGQFFLPFSTGNNPSEHLLAGFARTMKVGVLILVGCILVLMPISTVSGYVAFEPKLMPLFGLWALNNLLFVVFAEEVLFRGMVLGGLSKAFSRLGWNPFVALASSAALFGLGHFPGGLSYVGFATIAGLFYGTAYMKTGRLEAAIGVHFLLNFVHALLFTYPSLR